jgi:hypothetical protein
MEDTPDDMLFLFGNQGAANPTWLIDRVNV